MLTEAPKTTKILDGSRLSCPAIAPVRPATAEVGGGSPLGWEWLTLRGSPVITLLLSGAKCSLPESTEVILPAAGAGMMSSLASTARLFLPTRGPLPMATGEKFPVSF